MILWFYDYDCAICSAVAVREGVINEVSSFFCNVWGREERSVDLIALPRGCDGHMSKQVRGENEV